MSYEQRAWFTTAAHGVSVSALPGGVMKLCSGRSSSSWATYIDVSSSPWICSNGSIVSRTYCRLSEDPGRDDVLSSERPRFRRFRSNRLVRRFTKLRKASDCQLCIDTSWRYFSLRTLSNTRWRQWKEETTTESEWDYSIHEVTCILMHQLCVRGRTVGLESSIWREGRSDVQHASERRDPWPTMLNKALNIPIVTVVLC